VLVSFFDIDRVEVLRGPQGTLYGRNTTAGVVNLISNKPANTFQAAVNAGFGNFGTYQADAMVNVPITDAFAIRASGAYERRDNFIKSGVDTPYSYNPFKNNLSGRLQALWHINDDMTLLLKGDYSDIKGNTAYFSRAEYAYDLTDPLNPRYRNADEKTVRTLQFAYPGPSDTHNKTWGISGEYNWDFGPMTLTYLGSYRKFDRNENFVANLGFPVAGPFTGNYKQNSQELRFASNDWGKLKVQFGGYYFKEKSFTALYLLGLEALIGKPYYGFPENTLSESYAGFGQATYSLTSTLHLTGGVRYSHDRKERHGGTVFQDGPTFNAATDTLLLNYADRSFSKITWRGGVDWDVNNRTLLYGSVSTGYKAGGFNDGCLAGTSYGGVLCNQPQPTNVLYFKPETLTSYEVGFKMHTSDNTFRLNGSAFYYDYQNLQLSQTAICEGGGPCQVTQNAAKAKVEGVELESTVAPSARNRFDLSFTWLHAVYRQYEPLAGIDYTGRSLDRSPTFVASAGYTYTLPLANDGTVTASVHSRLSDSYVLTNYSVPAQFRQPSYTRTDVTVGYNAPGQRWYVQGFAHNLENHIQITSIDGSDNITISDPRTYGVRAGFKF
jgi:iron complex outermembrane receptor protein